LSKLWVSNDYLWPAVKSPKSLVSLSLKWAPLSKAQKQVSFTLSNFDLFVLENTGTCVATEELNAASICLTLFIYLRRPPPLMSKVQYGTEQPTMQHIYVI
jgi:hypothetical protein